MVMTTRRPHDDTTLEVGPLRGSVDETAGPDDTVPDEKTRGFGLADTMSCSDFIGESTPVTSDFSGDQKSHMIGVCTLCGEIYTSHEKFCPTDGTRLYPVLSTEALLRDSGAGRVLNGRYLLTGVLARSPKGDCDVRSASAPEERCGHQIHSPPCGDSRRDDRTPSLKLRALQRSRIQVLSRSWILG